MSDSPEGSESEEQATGPTEAPVLEPTFGVDVAGCAQRWPLRSEEEALQRIRLIGIETNSSSDAVIGELPDEALCSPGTQIGFLVDNNPALGLWITDCTPQGEPLHEVHRPGRPPYVVGRHCTDEEEAVREANADSRVCLAAYLLEHGVPFHWPELRRYNLEGWSYYPDCDSLQPLVVARHPVIGLVFVQAAEESEPPITDSEGEWVEEE